MDLGTGSPYWDAQWVGLWLASERGCAGMDGSPTVGQDGGTLYCTALFLSPDGRFLCMIRSFQQPGNLTIR